MLSLHTFRKGDIKPFSDKLIIIIKSGSKIMRTWLYPDPQRKDNTTIYYNYSIIHLRTWLNPYNLGDGLVFSTTKPTKLDQSTRCLSSNQDPGGYSTNPDPGGFATNPDPGGYLTNPDSSGYTIQDPLFAKDLRKKVTCLTLLDTLHFNSVFYLYLRTVKMKEYNC